MMAPQSWMELASIDQLYTSLKKQSFTDEQTYILAHGFDKDENGIKLPDPDRLYNFRLPENFEAVFSVYRSALCICGELLLLVLFTKVFFNIGKIDVGRIL